jgi:hypothetical protein
MVRGEMLSDGVENCCIWYYSTAAFPNLQTLRGKTPFTTSMDLATSESVLYLDNESDTEILFIATLSAASELL